MDALTRDKALHGEAQLTVTFDDNDVASAYIYKREGYAPITSYCPLAIALRRALGFKNATPLAVKVGRDKAVVSLDANEEVLFLSGARFEAELPKTAREFVRQFDYEGNVTLDAPKTFSLTFKRVEDK